MRIAVVGAGGVGLAEQRGRLAHGDRTGAEGFDGESERGEFLGAVEQFLDGRFIELDDFGDQEDLPLHAVLRQRGLQLLVDDALMGGVLVHDDQAVAGLRDDIGFMDLRARRTQGSVEEIGRWGFLETHVSGRRADVEG
jgi:hypothetical protein